MTDTLKTEVLEQIDKHLPKMVAGELKKRIELVDALEQKNVELGLQIHKYVEELEGLRKLKLKSENLQKMEKELKEKSDRINDREYDAGLNEVKYQLANEKLVSRKMMEFIGQLTRAPLVRKVFQKQIMNTGNSYPQGVTESEDILED